MCSLLQFLFDGIQLDVECSFHSPALCCTQDDPKTKSTIAGLVISRGLPFNHFDHEETITVFQNTMQPRYHHVSHSTLKRDAMKLWAMAKQLIIDGFLNLNARVNITTNVWFAGHGFPGSYLCVTAHWIEPSTWEADKPAYSPNWDIPTRWNFTYHMFHLIRSSLEMCMCLKDHLDAQKRKHISSLEGALDFGKEILTIEVQDNEATPLSDEEITLDAASQGTMASGSGGEEPKFDYDLTHYDIDD
ncbi:hypothetical protein Tco_1207148 [Tanacetum coccineum]